jgi:hypothetical protein
MYPGSIFAKKGIERIADKILPETGKSPAPSPAPSADPAFPPAESLSPVNAPAPR